MQTVKKLFYNIYNIMKRKKTSFKVFFHLNNIQTDYQYYVTLPGVPGRPSLPLQSSLVDVREYSTGRDRGPSTPCLVLYQVLQTNQLMILPHKNMKIKCRLFINYQFMKMSFSHPHSIITVKFSHFVSSLYYLKYTAKYTYI